MVQRERLIAKGELTVEECWGAVSKGVAGVSRVTRAGWNMIDGFASCLHAAGPGAGVSAPDAHAGHHLGAVGILGTLGPASFVRVSYVVCWAGAGANAVQLATERVHSARGRVARFPNVYV